MFVGCGVSPLSMIELAHPLTTGGGPVIPDGAIVDDAQANAVIVDDAQGDAVITDAE